MARYVAKIRPGVGGAPKGTPSPFKGQKRSFSLEMRAHISAALSLAGKGRKKSKEHCANIGNALRGRKLSAEHRRKISETRKRLKIVPVTKGLRKATHPHLIKYGVQGERHWAWKDGLAKARAALRATSEYKVWRDAVFARDNWTCQKCFKRGRYIEAHHIRDFANYPDLRLQVSNGQTLCKKCHKELTHGNRAKARDAAGRFVRGSSEADLSRTG